jgi:hypothetical protein
MLAKRGRGRPKGAKNKEQRHAGAKFKRLYDTAVKNRDGVTPDGLKKRRQWLNEFERQALREVADYCEQDCSQERRDWIHKCTKRAYDLLRLMATNYSQKEWNKLERDWD